VALQSAFTYAPLPSPASRAVWAEAGDERRSPGFEERRRDGPGRGPTEDRLTEVREDPDNLYVPIRGHDPMKNGCRALPHSLYNCLEMHPLVRRGAVAGSALGLLAGWRGRS
jgi:hypothetical protein